MKSAILREVLLALFFCIYLVLPYIVTIDIFIYSVIELVVKASNSFFMKKKVAEPPLFLTILYIVYYFLLFWISMPKTKT